jgi:cell fate (sporulation/competence/biofilm development) regulator YlbF (YheA/YmcA/DUF963 family)
MSEVIELTEKLGKAICESQEAKNLREARKALNAQKDVIQLLNDYQAQSDKVAKLEEERKPVEVEDKHKLQELHDKLVSSDLFKKFTAAQVEYVDMMRRVNQVLRKHLAETERD